MRTRIEADLRASGHWTVLAAVVDDNVAIDRHGRSIVRRQRERIAAAPRYGDEPGPLDGKDGRGSPEPRAIDGLGRNRRIDLFDCRDPFGDGRVEVPGVKPGSHAERRTDTDQGDEKQ